MIYKIERIQNLGELDVERMVKESEQGGYRFLTRLIEDYKDGTNTFNKTGEALFGVKDKTGSTVAIGGINISPFSENEKIGRLQRFYVEDKARRYGIGSLLLHVITEHAKEHFSSLSVRTESSIADEFYRANGFEFDDSETGTTHVKVLTA